MLNKTIEFIVRDEMQETKLAILREESLGSTILKTYWFSFEGKEYLKTIIRPLVKEVCKLTKKQALEVDPAKVPEATAKANLQKVIKIVSNFFNNFCQSYNLFPKDMESVLFVLYTLLTEVEGAKKSHLGLGYSETALRLFGGFLLLRFICPAIVSPVKYGLVKNVTLTSQKSLVLVSKILQSIANQVEFDLEKDTHMGPANALVQSSMPQMMSFLDKLMHRIDQETED